MFPKDGRFFCEGMVWSERADDSELEGKRHIDRCLACGRIVQQEQGSERELPEMRAITSPADEEEKN